MRRTLFAALLVLSTFAPTALARGILVPDDPKTAPLAMVEYKVNVAMEDQVAVTTVEQTFRNHTDRDLEATYLFPVPTGASVNKFTMWIDGKETSGELLDAKKASDLYTSYVRRTHDPALLEYLGNGLMRMKVFPVPPSKGGAFGDVKVKLSYTAVAKQDGGVVEFVYPLKTDGGATRTLEQFAVTITIKSQKPIQSVYSPTHAVDVKRTSDRLVQVEFAKSQAMLDKDFQLFYSVGAGEIGLTPVLYRPASAEDGYFMLLLNPQTEAAKEKRVPRDVVMVLDTSGSMTDTKMSQAKQALRRCLDQLGDQDRFGVVGFATAVDPYRPDLTAATKDELEKAGKWVDDLRAGGGTAIQPALDAALAMRGKDAARSFTVVFFTDGQPTVGERDPRKIVRHVTDASTAGTRLFTFGVGDDVNAAMLDQLADATRAVSTYVRPAEDIEAKATALYAKISHPVMTNVRLTTGPDVRLAEVYPQPLPDLFHGSQLVVFGRFHGSGRTQVKLSGTVGTEAKVFTYDVDFPTRTDNDRKFVEHLWARRKVGFVLDQIRVNGEQQELVGEATTLAKKYGIATPYTSYLVVPDAVMPVAEPNRWKDAKGQPLPPGVTPMGGAGGMPTAGAGFGGISGGIGGGLGGIAGAPGVPMPKVDEFAKKLAADAKPGDPKAGDGIARSRGGLQDKAIDDVLSKLKPDERKAAYAQTLERARYECENLKQADRNYKGGGLAKNQAGRLGVDLAEASGQLRNQSRLTQTANRQASGRNCVEIGGVWVDDQFQATTKTVTVKAQSDAYFRILERNPEMKDVFRLGNRLVWIAPSGTALVIDEADGADKIDDKDLDALFAKK